MNIKGKESGLCRAQKLEKKSEKEASTIRGRFKPTHPIVSIVRSLGLRFLVGDHLGVYVVRRAGRYDLLGIT